MGQPHPHVHRLSPPESKISLFRSLFHGRDDIYARRFESRKTGKSGYAPACANEWVPGVCDKPRIKCAACPHQRFLPVTDDAIRWHLSGQDAELPISFDCNGVMEVDLLCAEARLAVELDGSQHLDSPEAYRRDRRKDMLLQQHGYFVLRFLADDVGKQLDTVLDAILRAMTHRLRGASDGSEPDSDGA